MKLRARLVLVALLCACAREPEHWNVLLISIDTLRADHLSCYGYPLATTPHLDRLAAEGLRFTAAESPRAKTTPAMASVFTGLYPHEHGVRDLTTRLGPEVPLLAESFQAARYRTGAIIGNWVLTNERSGLRRGFDLWEESLPDTKGVPPHDAPQRAARSLTDGALAMLDLTDATDGVDPHLAVVAPDRPWFLWLHYMDPHGAYEPPADQRVFHSPPRWILPESPAPDTRHPRRVADYNVPAPAWRADGAFDAAAVVDLYDGEIRYSDAEIGRLVEALRAQGMLARTFVVVTADHGESLGEHDYWFEHGLYAYEATCRVPLIVRYPDLWPERPAAGVRDGLVSLADLAPTLAELCGVAAPARSKVPRLMRGVSRAAEWRTNGGGEHPVFFEKVERAEDARTVQTKGVRIGDWKLLRRFTHRESGERELVVLSDELYDLRTDPLEAHDLSGAPPPEAPLASLDAMLVAFTAADVHFAEVAEQLRRLREELERTDPRTLKLLEALGYY